MSDHIYLANMTFEVHIGAGDGERADEQPIEVDVDLTVNLKPAGESDDLEKTVDYGAVYRVVRQIVESTSFRLLEALAEAISHEILSEFPVLEVGIRVRKPAVQLGGPIDYAGVEIWRRRSPA